VGFLESSPSPHNQIKLNITGETPLCSALRQSIDIMTSSRKAKVALDAQSRDAADHQLQWHEWLHSRLPTSTNISRNRRSYQRKTHCESHTDVFDWQTCMNHCHGQ